MSEVETVEVKIEVPKQVLDFLEVLGENNKADLSGTFLRGFGRDLSWTLEDPDAARLTLGQIVKKHGLHKISLLQSFDIQRLVKEDC